MPRFVDRPDALQIPLETREHRVKFFAHRSISRMRLPGPVHTLDARGRYVPTPEPNSRPAIVKVWPAQANTTADHSRYLTRGKGMDGQDAPLFSAEQHQADHRAFADRASGDTHQYRLVLALVPPVVLSWAEFTRAFMRQVSTDVRSRLDWLGAAHHDTAYPHVHVQLRATRDDQQPLYLTKDYYHHGLRYRVQELATSWLGRLTPQEVMRQHERLPEVTKDVLQITPIRAVRLTPEEVRERMAETQAQVQRFRERMQMNDRPLGRGTHA